MSSMITTNVDGNEGEISLPLSNKTFVDLILNFLGNKEKITFQKNFSFALRHNDIEQFYFLLSQKLEKEKNIFIDHFLVNILYNDRTTREISGINAFSKFLETRDVYPTDITLTWNLIVRFPNAENIENQVIELTFSTNGSIENKSEKSSENSAPEGQVLLTIHHTNQAWGIEILNLFKDKISCASLPTLKRVERARAFLSTYLKGEMFYFFAMFFTLSIGLIGATLGGESNIKDGEFHYEIARTVTSQGPDLETNISIMALDKMNSSYISLTANNLIKNQKLKEGLLKVATELQKKETLRNRFFFVLGSIFIAALLVKWYLKKLIDHYGMLSHILLTKRAELNQSNESLSKNSTEFYSATLFVFSIVTGVIGNSIYQLCQLYFL